MNGCHPLVGTLLFAIGLIGCTCRHGIIPSFVPSYVVNREHLTRLRTSVREPIALRYERYDRYLSRSLPTIPPEQGFPLSCPVVLTIKIPFPGSHLHRRGRHGAEDTRLVRTYMPDGGLDAIGVHERVGPFLPVQYGRLAKPVLERGL